MFRSYQNGFNKGFVIAFNNGLEISVQWGTPNYCSNRESNNESSKNAEVAVFNSHTNDNVTSIILGEECIGWATPEDVARYILIISSYNSISNNKTAR